MVVDKRGEAGRVGHEQPEGHLLPVDVGYRFVQSSSSERIISYGRPPCGVLHHRRSPEKLPFGDEERSQRRLQDCLQGYRGLVNVSLLVRHYTVSIYRK